MGRVYVCPVVIVTDAEGDSQRAKANDYLGQGLTRVRSCIATLANGLSEHVWTVCWVEATDWTLLDNDATCLNLTEILADRSVLDNTFPPGLKAQLRNRGFITQAESNTITTIRSALNLLVTKHYPGHQLEDALLGE